MKPYWISLDGLRAIAVMIVLLGHAGAPFPRSGGVGVDIFFVLSGFLITGILAREFSKCGRIDLGGFYARRFLRLSPCLVLTCAMVFGLAVLMHEPVPARPIVIALTYCANWSRALFGSDLGPLNHCWSLACEEQYYLLWPLVVIALEKIFRSNSARGVVLAAAAIALQAYRASIVGTVTPDRIFFGLDTHMDGLVLGSALSYFAGDLRKGLADALSYVLAPIAIACLVAIMGFLRWDNPLMGRVGFSLAAIASAVIIADLVYSPSSLIQRRLSAAPLVYIGRISYGLYLLHFPLFRAIDHVLPNERFLVAAPIKIAVSVGAAALSFRFFESRFTSTRNRLHLSASAPASPIHPNQPH